MATTPDIVVQVDGLDDLRRRFRQAGDKLATKELGQAGKAAADIVATAAKAKVPVLSGRAAASMRAVVLSGGGGVRFGNAKAPYAPWLDFGGKVGRNRSVVRPFIKQGRFIYPALAEHRSQVVEVYDDLVDGVLRRAGLT